MPPKETALPQNKMATAPIQRLLLSMGVPMILSMVLQAFYNIVDSYFVGNMSGGEGELALNALTLAFPIQMLMIAIGVGTGVGVNSLLSRSLGAGDRERASKIAGNSIFLGACTYIVFLLVGLFGVRAYFLTQTSDARILEMGTRYLTICCTLSFGAILAMIYEKLLQATGRTVLSTVAQFAGAVANIILDPIMIFGLLGCPKMGVAGAAYATVIGQILSFALLLIFHHAFNRDVDTHPRYFKPEREIVGEIYKIGVPAIIMQALMSVQTYAINIIFGRVGNEAVTAYGVYYKVQQFVFFAAFGMNNAMIPIIGFNFGARNDKRIKDGIKFGMIYTLAIMLAGMLLLQFSAAAFVGLFSLSEATTNLFVLAVRIITLSYLFAGASITYQGVFQAFGRGVSSLIVSLMRLIVFALPAAFLLALTANAADVIWCAFPIAEILTAAIGAVMLRRIYQRAVAEIAG
ncbi:MATE family efflux transporter [Synergistales bacterium]|nr:MATE family efflux transporter [Synergistales bacterium]GHV56161.1 MATE family efflux transporter [Synergistales bacterium]